MMQKMKNHNNFDIKTKMNEQNENSGASEIKGKKLTKMFINY